MEAPDSQKAARYAAQLDQARCNGRWHELPELARKIEKHAPNRKCLALTARSEAQVAAFLNQRPVTSASASSTNSLSNLISPLLTAIDHETAYPSDVFEARVCLAWIHYILGEPSRAVAQLPDDIVGTVSTLSSRNDSLDQWVQVCAVKGTFIKGYSQEQVATRYKAIQTYSSILPYLSAALSQSSTYPQFLVWSERLLSRLCGVSMQPKPLGTVTDWGTKLRMFRLWTELSKHGSNFSLAVAADNVAETEFTHRDVWHAYYHTLSVILAQGLLYAPKKSTDHPEVLQSADGLTEQEYLTSKLQQRAELKRVETTYETLLLKETRFPRASETNPEIELWVDEVFQNWRTMCGPAWQDEELGEGGKEAVTREVLNILYRAATKTFHSTQILRHLFTVHAWLAEFDLAFKAFDSYIEIITRGKDRAEKSGEEDTSLDDDNVALQTAVEAIRILCRFGSQKEAERAYNIGITIDKWLQQHTPASPPKRSREDPEAPTESIVSPTILAAAYRAVGISQARWTHFTYNAASRPGLQAAAAQTLRKALEPAFEDAHDVETLYALALLLAEMRDINGAIGVAKHAIALLSQPSSSNVLDGARPEPGSNAELDYFYRERKMIPLWHLLALLLTARSDYSIAFKACEAAIEQFWNPLTLFGDDIGNGELRKLYGGGSSEHLPEIFVEKRSVKHRTVNALVDHMDGLEKQSILQLKITQLRLVEVLEGPSAAVDCSEELLALYARLFGDPKPGQVRLQTGSTIAPPRSATGTIKGSILGRVRSTKRDTGRVTADPKRSLSATTSASRASTIGTQTKRAPAIQITDEHGKPPQKAKRQHHHRLPLHFKGHIPHGSGHRVESLNPENSVDSLEIITLPTQGTRSDDAVRNQTYNSEDANTTSHGGDELSPDLSFSSASQRSLESPDQPLRPIAHAKSHTKQPLPIGHTDQPPKQDIRLPTPVPGLSRPMSRPRFSVLQDRWQAVSLLVEVWLSIAGLYTRATMYADAKGAIDEALMLIEGLELEISLQLSNSKTLTGRDWSGGKSVEELWGDLWAEKATLAMALTSPHVALSDYEKALIHFPDHSSAVVGLSNILLDVYCQIIPPEPAEGVKSSAQHVPHSPVETPSTSPPLTEEKSSKPASAAGRMVSPEELNRVAARDRAYGLLSCLTKLGSGWDNSEAWFALARAYEESGQIDKAKEVLWWCIELEDNRPLRDWKKVSVGGYVL